MSKSPQIKIKAADAERIALYNPRFDSAEYRAWCRSVNEPARPNA